MPAEKAVMPADRTPAAGGWDTPPVAAVRPDTFAALLGIETRRLADGVAEAEVTVGPDHLNPHGTAHGTLLYALGGIALAAAANDRRPLRPLGRLDDDGRLDEQHSGLVSSVHVDYLRPAHRGDRLVARAELAERTAREDLFVVRVLRTPDDELVARLSGRASRRARREAG